MFKPTDWFDRVFEIGIVAKGVNGALELIGGLLLLLVTPAKIYHWAAALTEGELSHDPHDVVASYILHTAHGLTGHAVLYGAIYLLSHGAVKVGLVIGLLLNKLWAYPAMIAVLLGFIGYQIYRIVLSVSVGMVALTVFDVLIVVLTFREWGRQRRIARPDHKAKSTSHTSSASVSGAGNAPASGAGR